MKLSIDSCSVISGGDTVNLITKNIENSALSGLVTMLNSTSNSIAEFQWHVFSIGNNDQEMILTFLSSGLCFSVDYSNKSRQKAHYTMRYGN